MTSEDKKLSQLSIEDFEELSLGEQRQLFIEYAKSLSGNELARMFKFVMEEIDPRWRA